MFESDTYYHPRLDLWPKVPLRWAAALTEYPQSWTCLNIRHVDSLRQGGNPLFLLRHHSYTVGSGLCITPIQTLAETPYCLNKWVSLAFICQSFRGGPVALQTTCTCSESESLLHQRRGGRLKTCQTSSRFSSNVDDEDTHHLHDGSPPFRRVLSSSASPWTFSNWGFWWFFFPSSSHLRQCRWADFYLSGLWMLLWTEQIH